MKKLYAKVTAKKESSRRTSFRRASTATLPATDGHYGLKQIYEGVRPAVDIIAIHGHGGHWKRSWTDEASGTFWLRDLLPKALPQARILSYWYDTSNTSVTPIEDIAAGLLSELSQLRSVTVSRDRPIIILAHSSGGIFIKAALGAFGGPCHGEEIENDFTKIRSMTYGIVFFGVPQHAEDGFNVLSVINAEAGQVSGESPLMAALRRDLTWLKDSNVKFSQMAAEFTTTYFTEVPGQFTAGGDQTPTIKPESCDTPVTNVIRLDKTHGNMVKFPDTSDRDFQKVFACIFMMASEASKDGRTTSRV